MLKSDKPNLYFAALTFVASVFWADAGSAQDAGILTGVIKDAAGAPVAGAFVQMKNAERRLNFMVITQAEGKYTNNRLPAGKYVVQAIGGEQQSALSAPVEVAAGKSASLDLALTVARAPALPPAWPGRPPGVRGEEADAAAAGAGPQLPDGSGKAIIEPGRLTPPTYRSDEILPMFSPPVHLSTASVSAAPIPKLNASNRLRRIERVLLPVPASASSA